MFSQLIPSINSDIYLISVLLSFIISYSLNEAPIPSRKLKGLREANSIGEGSFAAVCVGEYSGQVNYLIMNDGVLFI